MSASLYQLAVLVAVTALAQNNVAPAVNSIEGTVLNDRTGLPLPRAHVVVSPAQAGLSPVAVDADEKGAFAIRDIASGRYSMSASRDGYLTTSVCWLGAVRMQQTFAIGTKEVIAGLTFRLRPFAVMAGRVTLEDGEPAMNIRVEAYREYRNHLRHGYALAGSAVTNDRGEYRLFGLHPGSYIVAATERPTAAEEQVRETQALRYTTTFYANSTKLGEALPVRLDYGQESGGMDVSMKRMRKVKLHGHVINGLTGDAVSSASIAMQRVDAHNTASIAVTVPVTFDHDHRFEIRDVTPESYVMWAESADGGKALVGHAPLTVGEADIDNVELTIVGERTGSAVLVVDGGVKLDDLVKLRFEPRNERGKVVDVSKVAGVDGFRFALMGDEMYDLFVSGLPNDFYVSAVRVNGVDVMPIGIEGVAAAVNRPFEVVIDSSGGRVSGRVMGSDDSLWSRASVALIPDPPRGRVQSYQEGAADENGLFQLRGVAPGKYILVGWLDEPPCDYYDADGLANCRAAGMSVEVQQAGEQNVDLKMKAVTRR
jgi:Carboxypeptidase regulatory-like domain